MAVGVEIHPKFLMSILDVWGENSNTNIWLGWKDVASDARNVVKWDFLSDFQPLCFVGKNM